MEARSNRESCRVQDNALWIFAWFPELQICPRNPHRIEFEWFLESQSDCNFGCRFVRNRILARETCCERCEACSGESSACPGDGCPDSSVRLSGDHCPP